MTQQSDKPNNQADSADMRGLHQGTLGYRGLAHRCRQQHPATLSNHENIGCQVTHSLVGVDVQFNG
jgi:hypothetical protein